MLLYIWFQSKLWPPLATILNFRWAQKVTRPVKDLKMNIQITFVYILTRNCTEGSGVCLDRMRDFFRFVNKWSSGDIGTCEYGIIVLPLSVDQSKKMETNAFIKMAQFYNNLINIVSFSIIFFQETLKRWYGNVIFMFILRFLTGLVTFWAHRKFKIVASGGQSLLTILNFRSA
jgi:hypothetical protein